MKCVKKGEEIRKVTDQEAPIMVRAGWNYCSRKEWREKVRDKIKKVEVKPKVEVKEIKEVKSTDKKGQGYSKYRNKKSQGN